MSDVMINKLRALNNYVRSDELNDFIAEVADEIERLRAENAGLQIRILTLLKKLDALVNNE